MAEVGLKPISVCIQNLQCVPSSQPSPRGATAFTVRGFTNKHEQTSQGLFLVESSIDWQVLTHLILPFSDPHFFSHLLSFNLLSFAEGLQPWQDTLVETTDAACHEAMQWVTHLHAQGSTSVLQALLASSTAEHGPIAEQECHHPLC